MQCYLYYIVAGNAKPFVHRICIITLKSMFLSHLIVIFKFLIYTNSLVDRAKMGNLIDICALLKANVEICIVHSFRNNSGFLLYIYGSPVVTYC